MRFMSYILVLAIIIGLVVSHFWQDLNPSPPKLSPESLEEIINDNKEVLRRLQELRDQLQQNQTQRPASL